MCGRVALGWMGFLLFTGMTAADYTSRLRQYTLIA
jgi:hypothetical protein